MTVRLTWLPTLESHRFTTLRERARVLPALHHHRAAQFDACCCGEFDRLGVELQASVLDGGRSVHHFILPAGALCALQLCAVDQRTARPHQPAAIQNRVEHHGRFDAVEARAPFIKDVLGLSSTVGIQPEPHPPRLWDDVRRWPFVFNGFRACKTHGIIRRTHRQHRRVRAGEVGGGGRDWAE